MSEEQTEPRKVAEKVELAQLSAKVPKALQDKIAATALERGLYNSDIIKEAVERYFAPDPSEELRKELSNLQKYSDSLADTVAEQERKITGLESDLEESREFLENLQGEHHKLAKYATELETAGKQNTGTADQIRAELATAKEQLATATRERDELKGKLKETLSTADIKLLTANQSKSNLLLEINAVGDLAIRSGLISLSSVQKVSPSYVPRKLRNQTAG